MSRLAFEHGIHGRSKRTAWDLGAPEGGEVVTDRNVNMNANRLLIARPRHLGSRPPAPALRSAAALRSADNHQGRLAPARRSTRRQGGDPAGHLTPPRRQNTRPPAWKTGGRQPGEDKATQPEFLMALDRQGTAPGRGYPAAGQYVARHYLYVPAHGPCLLAASWRPPSISCTHPVVYLCITRIEYSRQGTAGNPIRCPVGSATVVHGTSART
jgi:hypothetical protein